MEILCRCQIKFVLELNKYYFYKTNKGEENDFKRFNERTLEDLYV